MPSRRRRKRDFEDFMDEFDDPFDALVDRLMDSPQAQSVLAQARGILDKLGGAIDGRAAAQAKTQARRPRPAPAPQVDPVLLARMTLHFAPNDPLTQDTVKKRKKRLAELCHPDRGGSAEAMAAVNHAADILLKSLKTR